MVRTAANSPLMRFLGLKLRAHRERAGMGLRELARELGYKTHAKLSQWELGQLVPSTEDVASVLAKLNVTGGERDSLIAMARRVHEPTWIPGIAETLAATIEFERMARTISNVSPLLIPGPFQTGDYARGIMGQSPLADTQVAFRLGRRDILTRNDPVDYTAYIGESALRQPIVEPAMMAAQLRELQAIGERSNVAIQVIPSDTGFHPGLLGPFMRMDLDDGLSLVLCERHRQSTFVFDQEDVAAFVDAAEDVASIALSPSESARCIDEVKQEWESR